MKLLWGSRALPLSFSLPPWDLQSMLSGEVLITVENWYFSLVDQGCLNFQTRFRSWNRARSCYWICWWRCDNASRKGKAMTISSYSFSKVSEWSHTRVIQITLLSAQLLWNGLYGSLSLVTMLSVVNFCRLFTLAFVGTRIATVEEAVNSSFFSHL